MSQVVIIPHKSWSFQEILNLSFKLKLAGYTGIMKYVNEVSDDTTPPVGLVYLGSDLPRTMTAVLGDGGMGK